MHESRPATPRNVLIVDDSPDSARVIKLLLRTEGHLATTADDAESALDLVRTHAFDVALIDLTLPGISGMELALALRQNPAFRDCLLVAVTGHSREALPTLGPFDHHLVKPVDADALLALLKPA